MSILGLPKGGWEVVTRLQQESQPTYLVVRWAPFVHRCREVLEVQQGLGVPVLQEALGAQPHLQALQ